MTFKNEKIGEVAWGTVYISQDFVYTELLWENLDDTSKQIMLKACDNKVSKPAPLVACRRTETGLAVEEFWLALLEEGINEDTAQLIEEHINNDLYTYWLHKVKLTATEVIDLITI